MPKATKQENPLLNALQAVALASNEKGLVSESYARINDREIVSTDGIIAIGHPVKLGFVAFPNLKQLLTAVKACKGLPEVTHLGDVVTVRSGRSKAAIKCMPPDAISPIGPDLSICPIPEAVKDGLTFCGEICDDMSLHVMTSSVQMTENVFRSTDRASFREYWHGLKLPDLPIPKACITALSKLKEAPISMGWSETSVTFHYENGMWVKSLLFNHGWPKLEKDLFGNCSNTKPIPEEFFEGVKFIAAFEEPILIVDQNGMYSGNEDKAYNVTLNQSFKLSPERLLAVSPYAKTYCEGPNRSFVWLGDNRRGVISGMI